MDEVVRKAMEKWPQVPALFGWLGLDRRGRWLLKGKAIERQPLIAFINRNYESDEFGRWFFQNGPQRVFVHLAYTPWVVRANGSGQLETHTGQPVEQVQAAWLDEDGSLLLEWERGIALLDDSDLGWAFERLVMSDGQRPDDDALAEALERLHQNADADVFLEYAGRRVPIAGIHSSAVADRFGYQADPGPREGERSTT